MFIVVVQFDVNAGQADEFRTAVVEQASNSLALETDCHVFDVGHKPETASFFLYEKYTDAAAFDGHLKSEHFAAFDALVSPWVERKIVDTWTEVKGAQ